MGSFNVYKYGLGYRFPACRAITTTLFDIPAHQATEAGGIDSLELIPGLLKRVQIRTQYVQSVELTYSTGAL